MLLDVAKKAGEAKNETIQHYRAFEQKYEEEAKARAKLEKEVSDKDRVLN